MGFNFLEIVFNLNYLLGRDCRGDLTQFSDEIIRHILVLEKEEMQSFWERKQV